MIETKELHEAIDRIARTADGRILYLFLQAKLMEVVPPGPGGALRLNLGERMFAAKLTGLMAQGIADSDGHSSSTDASGRRAEPVIVIARSKPVDAAPRRPRGNERRVTADTFVPGYDAPRDASGSESA